MSFDDWHDFIRVITFIISLYSTIMLAVHYKNHHKDWNERTIDFWYAMMSWSIGGCILAVQGVYLDRPFTAGFVAVSAAIFVTGKAVHANGPWGSHAKDVR